MFPSAYEEQHHPEAARNHSYHDPYRWNTTTLTYILDRQEYLGHTVLCKSIRENFKLKKRRAATPEERIIFKNTHEAIIDQETWDKAQRLRKRNPKKLPNGTYSHRLAGMVFCADCGSRMSFSSPESKHRDFDVVYDSDSSWQCSKYRNMYVSCTSHFIKTSIPAACGDCTGVSDGGRELNKCVRESSACKIADRGFLISHYGSPQNHFSIQDCVLQS